MMMEKFQNKRLKPSASDEKSLIAHLFKNLSQKETNKELNWPRSEDGLYVPSVEAVKKLTRKNQLKKEEEKLKQRKLEDKSKIASILKSEVRQQAEEYNSSSPSQRTEIWLKENQKSLINNNPSIIPEVKKEKLRALLTKTDSKNELKEIENLDLEPNFPDWEAPFPDPKESTSFLHFLINLPSDSEEREDWLKKKGYGKREIKKLNLLREKVLADRTELDVLIEEEIAAWKKIRFTKGWFNYVRRETRKKDKEKVFRNVLKKTSIKAERYFALQKWQSFLLQRESFFNHVYLWKNFLLWKQEEDYSLFSQRHQKELQTLFLLYEDYLYPLRAKKLLKTMPLYYENFYKNKFFEHLDAKLQGSLETFKQKQCCEKKLHFLWILKDFKNLNEEKRMFMPVAPSLPDETEKPIKLGKILNRIKTREKKEEW